MEVEMDNRKTEFIKIRLTPEEKRNFKEYAEKHSMTITEAIRHFCYKIF